MGLVELLSGDEDDLLRRMAADFPDVVILPSVVRGDRLMYSEFDVEARKLARAEGLRAEFLAMDGERSFLAEYHADFAAQFALAVMQQASAEAIVGVAKYLVSSVRSLFKRGLIENPRNVEVNLRVKKLSISKQGIEVEGLEITASGEEIGTRFVQDLVDPQNLAEAMRLLADSDESADSEKH